MSTHNICFLWRNKKNINTFEMKKASYQGLCTVSLIMGLHEVLALSVFLKKQEDMIQSIRSCHCSNNVFTIYLQN